MNRKDFLSAVVPLAALSSGFTPGKKTYKSPVIQRIPPYLKQGDLIGIACPSGFLNFEECQAAIQKITEWGFNIRLGRTINAKDFTLAGTDEERAKDLQDMLDDPSVKAILLGRGGYGAVRIIDRIDFTGFKKRPKWIIGFSDATVFHAHISRNMGIATLHSKMCNSFPDDFSKATQTQIDTIDSIRQCLLGEKMKYSRKANEKNRFGDTTAPLVGGNLSILQNLCGSISDLQPEGKILFIEDVDEYPYKIDGMLWNLKRSGKLAHLKGLIVGEFRIKKDDPGDDFGKTIYDMVGEKINKYHYPVCFDFPVGHVRENYALKCGVRHRLVVSSTGTELTSLS